MILEVILATIVTLGNSLLLLVVYRDPFRCLRTPTVYLIANLGIADFLVGVLVGYSRAVESYFLYQGLQTPPFLNTTQYVFAGSAMFAAVCSIMAMSWDRFVAVADPTNYKTRVTAKRAKFCILAIWLHALFFAVLPVAGIKKLDFLVAYCYSHFLLPAVILTVVYIIIFKKLSTKLRSLDQVVRFENSTIDTRRSLDREHRLAVTILLVLIAFYSCFAPYFVKVHVQLLCQCEKFTTFLTFHFITNDVLFLSSLLDPIIYAWRLERFRKTFKTVFSFRRNVTVVLPGPTLTDD